MLSESMALLRTVLLGDAGVAALVQDATRIRGAWDRTADEAVRTGAVVVVELRGGRPRRSAPYVAQTAAVWCYSGISQGEAARLYDAVRAALTHRAAAETPAPGDPGLRLYAVELSSGTVGWAQDHAAWFVGSTWTIHTMGG